MPKLLVIETNSNFKGPVEHIDKLTSLGFKHSPIDQLKYTSHPTAFIIKDPTKNHYKNVTSHFLSSGYSKTGPSYSTHINFTKKDSDHWIQVAKEKEGTLVTFHPEVKI